jgi:hypothetical protein
MEVLGHAPVRFDGLNVWVSDLLDAGVWTWLDEGSVVVARNVYDELLGMLVLLEEPI